MYKVVIDTNVIISAVFCGGIPAEILELWKQDKFKIVINQEILKEYFLVLSRNKFSLPLSIIKAIMDRIDNKAIWSEKEITIDIIKADPDDNKFLEAALDRDADFIVTGDKHLLKLKEFRGIKIITPSIFLSLLK